MKTLKPITFDFVQCRRELDKLKALLDSKSELSEHGEIMPLFRESPHLTSLISTRLQDGGPADRIGYEFEVFGDFVADIVVGVSSQRTYCAIELEDAPSDSIFHRVGAKATTEWGRRLEHGFSQMVDWFFAWDDHKKSDGFAKHFGYGYVDFSGMLVIGRSAHVSDHDRTRLLWRSNKVSINSHKIICRTYDELYESLNREWGLMSLAAKSAIGELPSA